MTDQPDKKRRGRRGDGSIYWDDTKKCYRGEMSLGYSPSGRRRRVRAYGPTKAAVRDKLKEQVREAETGIKSSANYTVADAVEDWLTRGLAGRSEATVKKNQILARNHVIPGLGKAKLRELTTDDVEDWLKDKSAALATRTLKECRSVLSRAIARAQHSNRVLRNVADLAEVPDGRAGRPSKSLSFEQADALLKSSTKARIHAYLVVSLLTGVRTEEARALTWDRVHLDPDGDTPPHIEVWRSVRKGGETKTKKSRRTLALPPEAVRVLKEHRDEQDIERERAGNRWKRTGLVFCTRLGGPLAAGNVRRAMRAALRSAGLPEDWTPRETRHSFVSLMSANGAPIELIARLVGHASTTVTETVYRHELRPVITEGADIIGRVFKPNLEA
ncbi:tyrosine-type recombinase/integrase [Cryptosporangium sp. NPDC051539]|uniref:tyrosine-type recombinase/integrase n=1 Tax=Cryptosporangium sp. NPDC051539 TaxID=3363962 RepID=UPI003794ED06